MVHYVVNIGYYGVVFLFTLGIFFVIVQRIIMARKLKVQDAKTPSTSKNLMTIMSLFALLGLTWGVAFFSYGAMLIPSYYIFSILNAFQGNSNSQRKSELQAAFRVMSLDVNSM